MSNPAVTLSFDNTGTPEHQTAPSSAQRFDQLWGGIRIVDVAPTWTPRGKTEDSIALLIDGGTPNLCMYDYVNAEWLFAELSTTRIP